MFTHTRKYCTLGIRTKQFYLFLWINIFPIQVFINNINPTYYLKKWNNYINLNLYTHWDWRNLVSTNPFNVWDKFNLQKFIDHNSYQFYDSHTFVRCMYPQRLTGSCASISNYIHIFVLRTYSSMVLFHGCWADLHVWIHHCFRQWLVTYSVPNH